MNKFLGGWWFNNVRRHVKNEEEEEIKKNRDRRRRRRRGPKSLFVEDSGDGGGGAAAVGKSNSNMPGITLVSVLLSSAWALGAVLRAAHIKCPSGAGRGALRQDKFHAPAKRRDLRRHLLCIGFFEVRGRGRRSSTKASCYIEIHLVESTAAAFSLILHPLSQRSSGMCLVLKKKCFI